jgi:putative endonuclease
VAIQKAIMKNYYVYILFSKRNGTLYTGVTNDLVRRVFEHKEKLIEGFTKRYKVIIYKFTPFVMLNSLDYFCRNL